MNSPVPLTTIAAAAAMQLSDFPDRLSPIMVKELRQGLRQPTFVIAFLCLQVLLCIVVVVSVLSAPVGSQTGLRVGETVSGFFFVLLAIVILLVQPLRGLGALATEIKEDTLDLLLLTRLNSWRITFGKWLALVSQSALLVVAVFPYLILRYYLGGMQLFAELLGLFTLFVASASITGITVGFSATPSLVIRGLVALAMLVSLLIVPQFLLFSMVMGGRRGGGGSPFTITLSSAAEVSGYVGTLLMMLFIGYYFLEMGATQIAPPAENRSTMKRLSGLAALGLLAWLLPNDGITLFICWLLVVTLLMVDALSERPGFTSSVLRPFRRLGPLRYVGGTLLLPGWPSGLIFASLLAVITVVMCMKKILLTDPHADDIAIFCLLWFATILLPAMVTSLFMNHTKNRFTTYIIVLLASLIVSLVFFTIGAATNTAQDLLLLVPACPALGLMSFGQYSAPQSNDGLIWIAISTCAGYWAILFARSLGHWKRTRALDRQLVPRLPSAVVADPAGVA